MIRSMWVWPWLAVGCAGSSGGGVLAEFPDRAELEALANRPQPEQSVLSRGEPLETWQVQEPLLGFRGLVGTQPPPELEAAWRPMAAARPQWVLSEAASCVAREAARFVADQGGTFPNDVWDEVGLRCGVVAPSLNPRFYVLNLNGKVPEDLIRQKLSENLAQTLAELPKGPLLEVGLGVARTDAKVVSLSLWGQPRVALSEVTRGPDSIRFSGTLLTSEVQMQALSTRGEYGYSECKADSSMVLPRFSFECPFDERDGTVRVEVVARREGRYLGALILRFAFAPSGEMRRTIVRVRLDDKGSHATRSSVESLAAAINNLRKNAGFEPLALEAAQSQTASKLAPAYYSVLSGLLPERMADTIALGLQAGYDIQAPIRYAFFGTFVAPNELEAPDLALRILRSPNLRRVLLSPQAERIAVGWHEVSATKTMGVLAVSYVGLSDRSPTELRQEVLDALGKARADAGREAPSLLPVRIHEDDLEAFKTGTISLQQLGRWTLAKISQKYDKREFQMWALPSHRIRDIRFPAALLKADRVEVAIDVVPHRKEGSPWHQYTVLLVAPKRGVVVHRSPKEWSSGALSLAGLRGEAGELWRREGQQGTSVATAHHGQENWD